MNSGKFCCDNYGCELARLNSGGGARGVRFHPDSDAEAASSDREAV